MTNLTKRDLTLLAIALQDITLDNDRLPDMRAHAEQLLNKVFDAHDALRQAEKAA
jgi:hypothetical protein